MSELVAKATERNINMSSLKKLTKENSLSYGSLPFWSWNDKLEEKELRRQIRNMHDLKINGFFMHARGGLETEYLSEEWYNAVKVSVDEAKKLGMEAWSYDENGWPSGFAGGKLLDDPDNHSVFLTHEFTESFPESTDGIYAIYALKGTEKPVHTDKAVEGAEKYLLVYYKTDASYVDTMRDDITEKFIELTHAEYKEKLGEDFGKTMCGFFTDEPQYYRYKTPYSRFMDKWFNEEYGYSVFEAIPSMFCDYEGAKSHRYDYHRVTHTKFMENFAKKIYDWATENGIEITGHGIEEASLAGQMMCCGSVMPFYEYQHLPGIDYLGRGLATPLASKQLGSACEQLGKKKALSEMFACCGWDVTPEELKHIAELQYAGGVNIMCHHLYPYSERGQRKRDYPSHYSDHNPWQPYLKDFNEYFNNLGYLLSRGKEDADILIIHPIHSAWLVYQRIVGQIPTLENDFRELFCRLSEHQLPYHFGEESTMLRYGSVEGDKIKIGNCSYSTVVLPALDTLDKNTSDLLRKFKENGGKIYTFKHHLPTYIDGKPASGDEYAYLSGAKDLTDEGVFGELCSLVPFSLRTGDGKNVKEIISMSRQTEHGRLIYLTNLTSKEFKGLKLNVCGVKALCTLDIMTLETKALRGKVTENGCDILLDFEGSEAMVLIEEDAPAFLPYEQTQEKATVKFENKFTLAEMPENLLTLDRAEISKNGTDFTEMRPIERIRDNLLKERYAGKLWLKFRFNLEVLPEKLDFVNETPFVEELSVNGTVINISNNRWFDQYFASTDISGFVKLGKNEITLRYDYHQNDYVYHVLYGNVMESLRNCLVFETEIEAAYLKGSFAVKTDPAAFTVEPSQNGRYERSEPFTLTAQKKDVNIRNVAPDGYLFYGGKMKFSTVLNYKIGDATCLKITGRYAVCDVEVNGNFAGTLMFSKYLDIAKHLKEGENEVTLTMCNAYRNFLGPHHRGTVELMGVGPKTFSYENGWDNEKCADFNPNYSFVRFGLDV